MPAEQFANVFVSIPRQFDPDRLIQLFRGIGAPPGLQYRFAFRHSLQGDWARTRQMIAASQVVIADFSPTPDSGGAPDADVVTEATCARLGEKPAPVMILHRQPAHDLPWDWRQLTKIGGVRAVPIPEGIEPALRQIGGWLGHLCTQPAPPPPPPRKYKGSWDICIAQSFDRGGPDGFDFANFYKCVRGAANRLKGGPKVRLALFPKDKDAVEGWHRVQAGISRSAVMVVDLSPDSKSGKTADPNVITEAALGAFHYRVPVVACVQAGVKLSDDWSHIAPIVYEPGNLEHLTDQLAVRLQQVLPEAAATVRDPEMTATFQAGTRMFSPEEAPSTPTEDAERTPPMGVPGADTAILRPSSVRIPKPTQGVSAGAGALQGPTAAAATGPFERFLEATNAGKLDDALSHYQEAISLDPWQHALFNPEKFVVKAVLGGGPFGVVFRATRVPDEDNPREEEMVIKALLRPTRLGEDPDQLFANMDLLRQAPRQGILPILDWDRYPRGENNAWWHFWSPWKDDAVSLRTLVGGEGTVSEGDAAHIGAGIVMGLMSAHLFNVSHLAMRPSNVLVRRSGRSWEVWLRDFGFRPDFHTLLAEPEQPEWLNPLVDFATPEQKGEVPVTPGLASDIYSLGLLMLYMLFGRAEVDYETLEALEKLENQTLRSAIEGCLRYDPRARWGQLDPILEMLRPGATHDGIRKTQRVAVAGKADLPATTTDLDLFGRVISPDDVLDEAFSEEHRVPDAIASGDAEEAEIIVEETPTPLLRGATREEGPLRQPGQLQELDSAPAMLVADDPVPQRERPRPRYTPGEPKQMIVGIDLGTCNSLLSYIDENGEIKVVHHTQDSIVTPSAVYFPEPFTAEVGLDAKRMALFEPLNCAQYMKLSMGDPRRSKVFHGSKFSPEMLSALVLRRLVEQAVDEMGGEGSVEISDVVITVPSSWDDVRRESTRLAARLAGLNPMAVLSEPVAVALEVSLKHLREGKTVFVYDFGGGTFDVTIFKLEGKTVRLLGNMGLPTLGGKDLDQKLYDHLRLMFREEFTEQSPPDPDDDPALRWELLSKCEQVKIALCRKAPPQNITVSTGGCTGKYRISLEDFERLIAPEVDMTKNFVLGALLEAGQRAGDVDYVLSVGGSSQIPMVQRMLADIFGEEKLVGRQVNPQETVARGACRNAADIWCEAVRRAELPESAVPDGLPSKLGDAPVLREETPQALSMITLDEDGETQLVEVVIPQGTPWPARGTLIAETAEDHQMNVICRLRSGSSQDPDGTERLGTISFPLIPGVPKGCPLKLEFWYDGPDRLFIAMWDGASGKTQQLKVPWPGPTPRQTASWEETVSEVQVIID